MVSIDLAISGEEVVRTALSIATERIADMTPINELQFDTLEAYAQMRFASRGSQQWRLRNVKRVPAYLKGRGGSGGWAGYDNERKFLARKAGILGGTVSMGAAGLPPLHWRRGKAGGRPKGNEILYPSFFKGKRYNVRESHRDGFVWGSSYDVAAKHQFGRGRQPWDDIPLPKRVIIDGRDRALTRQLVNNVHAYVEASFAEFKDSAGNVFSGRELGHINGKVVSKNKLGKWVDAKGKYVKVQSGSAVVGLGRTGLGTNLRRTFGGRP